MEGVGSRLGRTSSRYGPAATVFNGPVRRWKKKWVHVSSSSSSSTVNYDSSQSNGHNNASTRLLLCRWTPLSSSSVANDSGSVAAEEPPRRRFRYTPIAVIEERKRAVRKEVEDEAKTNETNPFASPSSSKHDESKDRKDLKEETQESHTSHMDLGLSLNCQNEDLNSVGQNQDG